jgi:membrane protein implicated in regulation of membrane protease activity
MNVMKIASIITAATLIMYVIVVLLQVWASVMSWATFIKLTITSVVLIVAVFGVALLYREYVEEKNMKRDGYID